MFHGECVQKWSAQTCPLCREPFDAATQKRLNELKVQEWLAGILRQDAQDQDVWKRWMGCVAKYEADMMALMERVVSIIERQDASSNIMAIAIYKMEEHVRTFNNLEGFYFSHKDGTISSNM